MMKHSCSIISCIKCRFTKKYTVNQTTGCYEWYTLRRSPQFSINNTQHSINRAAYMLFGGELSDNDLVIRSCKNKFCVNIDHMFLGNHKDHGRVRNRAQKLTEQDKQEILKMHNEYGINKNQISKKFNISETAVRKFIKKSIVATPSKEIICNADDMYDHLRDDLDKQFEDLI